MRGLGADLVTVSQRRIRFRFCLQGIYKTHWLTMSTWKKTTTDSVSKKGEKVTTYSPRFNVIGVIS